MSRPLDIVVIGLTLTSSWGNGHATTYRSLLSGLQALGHRVLFLERDKPWYADHRDLPDPEFCALHLYDSADELFSRFGERLEAADAVIVGSYVPDGIEIIDRLAEVTDRLCFYDIDTPVTLARLARDDEEYVAARQIPRFAAYFSFTGGPTLERLEQGFGARRALPLYCSVREEQYRPTGAATRWDLGYLGTYSADRQPGLERLLLQPARALPDLRFVIAGSQFPEGIDWPENVERIEHLPPTEHAEFYSSQRFTLNLTRADMVAAGWSPSVRLFEAAACGTAIISDPWDGLTQLLPQDEAILIAESGEQVVRYLTEIPDPAREAIARTARSKIMERHTARARAAELADHLQRIVGDGGPPLQEVRRDAHLIAGASASGLSRQLADEG